MYREYKAIYVPIFFAGSEYKDLSVFIQVVINGLADLEVERCRQKETVF